jgi:hypothetical protein
MPNNSCKFLPLDKNRQTKLLNKSLAIVISADCKKAGKHISVYRLSRLISSYQNLKSKPMASV